MGNVDTDFAGSRVVEAVTGGSTGKVAWGPVVPTMMNHKADGSCETVNLFKFVNDMGEEVPGGSLDKEGNYNAPAGATKIAYVYDNVVIPQNDLPMVKAEMKSIALVAKARRIAVYYSQIAAYQAKTDYGVELLEIRKALTPKRKVEINLNVMVAKVEKTCEMTT